jgi:uncharacterized protein involved in exopolysaccharide biosynthesis
LINKKGESMAYSFDVWYYINMLKKWCTLITAIVVVSVIASAVSVIAKPTVYVSNVRLFLGGDNQYVTLSLSRVLGVTDIPSSSKDVITAILQSNKMRNDINEQFKNERLSGWTLNTYVVTGGLLVEVTGPDPELTQKIADYAVQNLDNINKKLGVTPTTPMVKVLDEASYGQPKNKDIMRKLILAAILSFLTTCLFISLYDYVKTLKKAAH